ncbi:MAG: C40 family peptidase, partial [Lachnospiraceae bacterium]|nr:C40 family peptidase [Lachnospiraceae bacterium]
KQESANYDAQIARMRQEANALKVKIQQEQAELKKIEEAERRSAAANGSYTVSPSVADIINGASGSDLGKQIARYGCQYIGNPYVLGGTSLTNGADCSGFTYRIYSNFGYTIPRTSYQQRSAGTEVSYENAQPGDLICYEGHVALYIGGGYIVHASNVKTGIKVSKATYKKILSVRRII